METNLSEVSSIQMAVLKSGDEELIGAEVVRNICWEHCKRNWNPRTHKFIEIESTLKVARDWGRME